MCDPGDKTQSKEPNMTESYEQRREEHKERTDPSEEEAERGQEKMYPKRGPDTLPNVKPGTGGYQGRDPKDDMPPKLPSVPESQDD